jgi:hypothetical protein
LPTTDSLLFTHVQNADFQNLLRQFYPILLSIFAGFGVLISQIRAPHTRTREAKK